MKEKTNPGNIVLWINGDDKFNHKGLPACIENTERDFNSRIRTLEDQVNSCNIKNIKGNKYWYQWIDDRHVYRGKDDPRPPIEAKIFKLEDELKIKLEQMRSCVIKKIGKHLVIDLEIFRKHISKTPVGDQVNIGEVLAQ